MHNVVINNVEVTANDDWTVLEAAKKAGFQIPTLCKMEGCAPLGACRVCMVEVEGMGRLQAACSTPVSDGMVVSTSTPKVHAARRTVVELLLSEHEGLCPFCDRDTDCELRQVAGTLGIESNRYKGEKPTRKIDESKFSIYRDSGKCIKCRRCVEVCNEVQGVGALFPQGRGFDTFIGPAFSRDLAEVTCVECGQCAAVCPVGAIGEHRHIDEVRHALADSSKRVIVQTAPAIRAALGECFGYPPGSVVTGKMNAALRRIGFDNVFSTNFTADLTIMEEATELLGRLTAALRDGQETHLPLITSCCPGWINFAEATYADLLPYISTCKSPQQMFGAVAKAYYAEREGVAPEDLVVVSVMPCTAKKGESAREDMRVDGVPDVDYVLTTRELATMIRSVGLDFSALPSEEADMPFGMSTGAADIFANTGGVMEAALRTAYATVTGRPLPGENLHVVPIAGLQGVKEASVMLENVLPEWSFLEGVEASVAVAHGLGNARTLIDGIGTGERNHIFIEIMACPGGCIGGGGQPRMTSDAVRKARIASLVSVDEQKELRGSHENPYVKTLYED
ncbi:MAG: NADH-dependent [FeFe] hydrogenase, group A6, partial [bacterium]